MHVDIQAKGFELSETLHKHIVKQLQSSFRISKKKVRKIIIRLFNDTSSRQRYIKRCRVQAVVNGLPQVITEYRSKNFYVASDTAIQRAQRAVSKRLRKQRNYHRNLIQHNVGGFA